MYLYNRPIPSCLLSLCKKESLCETIHEKNFPLEIHFLASQTHFLEWVDARIYLETGIIMAIQKCKSGLGLLKYHQFTQRAAGINAFL